MKRFCGYCYTPKQKQVPAIGDVEGIPVCRKHWRKHAPRSSAFLYTRTKRKPKS